VLFTIGRIPLASSSSEKFSKTVPSEDGFIADYNINNAKLFHTEDGYN
jgi:hypothetical protein